MDDWMIERWRTANRPIWLLSHVANEKKKIKRNLLSSNNNDRNQKKQIVPFEIYVE